MAYMAMEETLQKYNNIYKVVLLAAKRAQELSEGANPLVSRKGISKVTTLSLVEIKEGKVYLVDDSQPAKGKKGKK